MATDDRGGRTVKVFGSAVAKAEPDVAEVTLAVSRLEPTPAAAFAAARRAAGAVGEYLAGAGLTEVGTSRVTLDQQFAFDRGRRRMQGYEARIGFHLVLRDLDRTDAVLTGAIDAGANELTAVTFQTTRLAAVRADARRQAVAAARAKAELYAAAAGMAVGGPVAIEDVSPDAVAGGRESHMVRGGAAGEVGDATGEAQAIDPAAITVTAAVTITYQLVAVDGLAPAGVEPAPRP